MSCSLLTRCCNAMKSKCLNFCLYSSASIEDSLTKQRKRRRRRKRPSLSNEAGTDSSSASDDDILILPNVDQNACPKQKHPVEPQLSLDLQGYVSK